MELITLILCIVNLILLIVLLIGLYQIKGRRNGENDKRQEDIINPINNLKENIASLNQRSLDGNKNLLDEIARRAEATTNQIENLSGRMMDFQEKQQGKINGTLDKIQSEMAGMRSENRESLDQINSIVTEKMQKTLDEKFNGAFETVVKNMSEIGKTLSESQEKQQKNTEEKLEGINRIVNEKLQKTLDDKLNGMSETVVRNMAELGKRLDESQARLQKSNEEKLEKLAKHFETIRIAVIAQLENIRNSNGDNLEKLRKDNQESLDKINSTVNEKLQKSLDEKLNGTSESVVRNMTELGKTLNESQERQQKSTEDKLEKLEENFDKIRNDINSTLKEIREANFESMEKLRRDNQESLDKINNTVNEKLQKTLDDKFSQSFEAVNKRLAEVYEGLGEMKNVASGVSDLKNVLANVKTRGILGEIQLGAIISEILAPEQYEEQVSVVPDSSERVDFAVKLPGMEDGEYVYLPIDSKFPGNTYANLVDAYNSGKPEELREKRKSLETEIHRSAKSIRDKYIAPPHTTGFAIMFLPFEGLYAEVVNMGLVEPLQRQYKVNIAGPSTMAAMLNSLQMGFRTLAIQKKSGEVWKILEAAKKEFSTFETVLNQTRDRLRQADENLDKLIGTRTRMINRKLSTVSALSSTEEAENMLAE